MEEIYLLAIGISFCFTSILFLLLSPRQRDLLLTRFKLRGRRTSSADTPPRSLSPNKISTVSTGLNEYLDSIPPSRREALVEVAKDLPATQREKIGGVELDAQTLIQNIMPFTAHWTKCKGSTLLPTGISVDEIKALGDFPDYATLSGVPLPNPHEEFDIEKALPRPYRPFRWAYHQTMCMCLLQ